MSKRLFFSILLLLVSLPVSADTYPKLDISGFKKWEYRGAQVTPGSNYFAGLSYLGFSPTATGSPWQERLQLRITTQLSEKLTVSYDIEQQPETPERYNVVLNYDNKHILTFGDFTATFSGNEFASTTKVLNGMMFTSKDEGYDLIAVPSTKLKSEVQGLTSQKGNNTRGPYSLGNGSIIEGSEHIELNGVALEKEKDYIIDYLEGKITFSRILLETDEFKYSYEFTNISDLFFPALSRKNFFGFQSRFNIDPATWGRPQPEPKEIILNNYEVFPSPLPKHPGGPEEEIRGEEESGRYQLEHYPVVRFSEVLIFHGATLTKDVDYNINYEKGTVTLLVKNLPSLEDRLRVSYDYKKTESVQEILPGSGSRGPYQLFHQNVVPDSEQIYINDRIQSPLLDYNIDYENGRLIFNFLVPSTAVIKADYRYVAKSVLPSAPPPAFRQQLTVGMTYLRESAKSGLGTAVASNSETFRGTDVIANRNTLYISRPPLIPSQEEGVLIVSIDGKLLTEEVDYVVPTVEVDPITGYARVIPETRLAYLNDRHDLTDGYYTGTIKLFITPEASENVSVAYTYYKSVVGRYSGTGNGGRGPYYIQGYRNLLPGTERVEVWETGTGNIVTYTRNSSFEPDAGDTGYSINYYKDNPYITFNRELGPNQNFSVYFQYLPPNTLIGNDVKQEITGFDADYSLGEFIELSGNFATSKVDRVTISKSTVESVSFISPTKVVKVTQHDTPAIIEGTEKVYINNYLRNRDIDYAIDYTSGTISFYYTTLTSADAVVVEYEYPDPSGIPKVGDTVDMAYKLGAKSSLGPLSITYNQKAVGFDFSPLGGMAIGVGSSYRDFSADFNPNFHGLTAGFTYLENIDPIAGSRESFTRRYDQSYILGANPFGWAGMSASFRHVETLGDPLNSSGSRSAHSELKEYSGSLNPRGLWLGPISHSHNYDGKLTDSWDYLGNTFSRNKYFHTRHDLGFTRRLKGGFDFAFSEPYTLADYETPQQSLSSKSTTQDFAYDLSLDLTYGALRKWTAYAKLLNHEELNHVPSREVLQTLNTSYHTELVPLELLELSYDQERQETPSVLVEGKNPKNEKEATNVTLRPVANFSTVWQHTSDSTVHETGRESSGFSDRYTADWTVISAEHIEFGASVSKYGRSETGPSGTFEAVQADIDSFSHSYRLTWSPFEQLSVSPGFSREDYKYVNSIQAPLEAQAETTALGITYNPLEELETSLDYNLKITSTPTVSPRHKATLNLKASYRVFDWGTVSISEDLEDNRGEVQAGGTFPDLDYSKITRSVGINFSIPQENPILSTIVFNLAYKTVGYDNRLAGRDDEDLHAAMITFDGALNF